MKKKMILSLLFVVSLSPMLLNQYGGAKGIQEVTGLLNLYNPLGIASVFSFALGIWVDFKRTNLNNVCPHLNKVLSVLGMVGIVVSEIYEFLTWHVMTITGEMSIKNSIEFAFPEFYLGFIVSILMIFAYFLIEKKLKDE